MWFAKSLMMLRIMWSILGSALVWSISAHEMNHTADPLPVGIAPKDAWENFVRDNSNSLTSLNVDGIGSFDVNGRQHQNTFDVTANHEMLHGAVGVKFNTETVPKALNEDLNKTNLGRDQMVMRAKEDAANFYGDQEGFRISTAGDIRLEALSDTPDTVVYAGGSGFFVACLTAFAQHLPLAIAPDHIWALISYAFSKHVDIHTEELRNNFVQCEGKKRLEVNADQFLMSGGDPALGSSAQQWESEIFPSFSSQIEEHIGHKIHSAIVSDFSTTTSTARAAHEITLMSAMKSYFSFGMGTACGIPSITLHGTEEDWVALRARAEDLGKLMTPKIADKWMPVLLPVLDEFVYSYGGNVNHGFWQSMVKLRDMPFSSGASSFVSGWLQIFFPYLKSGIFNDQLRPWQEMYFRGPEPDEIPAIVSSVPVDWDYHGDNHELHFHAGFTGFTQDPSDGSITPLIGWFVTHDPPREPGARLGVVTREIEALLKGHAAEAQSENLDKTAPWYTRVHTLLLERVSLEDPARRSVLKRKLDRMEATGRYNDKYHEIMQELHEGRPAKHWDQFMTDAMIKEFYERKKTEL